MFWIPIFGLILLDIAAHTRVTAKIIFFFSAARYLIHTVITKDKEDSIYEAFQLVLVWSSDRFSTIIGVLSLAIYLLDLRGVINLHGWLWIPAAGALGLLIHTIKAALRLDFALIKDMLEIYKRWHVAKLVMVNILTLLWEM